MKVLVVDDEEYVAELIQRALEQLGFSSVFAPSADVADELLAEEPVDAVTLDLGMPGRGGLDWLESIARTHPDLASRTLVITGMDLPADSVERVATCGAGVLAKPFTLEGLNEALRSQIARIEYRRLHDN